MDKLVERVKNIFIAPDLVWDEIGLEQKTNTDLIKDYLAYIAAVPSIAGFLGLIFSGENFFNALLWGVLFYLASIGGVFLTAKTLVFLSSSFRAKQDEDTYLKLAAYSSTPILLAGIFFLIPPFYWLSVVGLYGFYFFWLGFQKIVDCPLEERFNFVFISIIAFLLIMVLVFILPALFSGSAVYDTVL